MADEQRRCDRQPALFLIAQELCCTGMTDGFCSPKSTEVCLCWSRAERLLHESAFSARALVWILKHRTTIEQEAGKAALEAHVSRVPEGVKR